MEVTQPLDPNQVTNGLASGEKKSSSFALSFKRSIDKKNSTAVKASISAGSQHVMSNDVGIMLFGLIAVFLICQLPSSILRLITFKNLSIFFQPFYASSLDVSNFLIVTNSTLNCLLYVMLGKKFRREFLHTFFPRCYREPVNMNNNFL
jgi:hypothetical protein